MAVENWYLMHEMVDLAAAQAEKVGEEVTTLGSDFVNVVVRVRMVGRSLVVSDVMKRYMCFLKTNAGVR